MLTICHVPVAAALSSAVFPVRPRMTAKVSQCGADNISYCQQDKLLGKHALCTAAFLPAWRNVPFVHNSTRQNPSVKIKWSMTQGISMFLCIYCCFCCLVSSLQERGRVMYKLADLMERDREELAQLETLVSD
jgi:hypothetical protein